MSSSAKKKVNESSSSILKENRPNRNPSPHLNRTHHLFVASTLRQQSTRQVFASSSPPLPKKALVFDTGFRLSLSLLSLSAAVSLSLSLLSLSLSLSLSCCLSLLSLSLSSHTRDALVDPDDTDSDDESYNLGVAFKQPVLASGASLLPEEQTTSTKGCSWSRASRQQTWGAQSSWSSWWQWWPCGPLPLLCSYVGYVRSPTGCRLCTKSYRVYVGHVPALRGGTHRGMFRHYYSNTVLCISHKSSWKDLLSLATTMMSELETVLSECLCQCPKCQNIWLTRDNASIYDWQDRMPLIYASYFFYFIRNRYIRIIKSMPVILD